MKKITIAILTIIITQLCFSQEMVFDTFNAFEKLKSNKNRSFALPDEKTGDLMLMMTSKNSIQGILLDNQYKEKLRINGESLPTKYKHFLGYSINEDIYAILFTNEIQSKFGAIQFNINDNSNSEKILDFKLKKEQFIESLVYNNEIFLFTITKRSSDLNIYKFDKNFTPEKHTVSLDKASYPKTPGSNIKLSVATLFNGIPNSLNVPGGAAKIEIRNPNVIETTSKKIKIYPLGNTVIFSFDNNPDKTDLFTLDLETLKLSYKSFDKVSKDRDTYKNNNSYFFDNKLFQIASSKKIMNFRIIDIDTDKILKDYTIKKEDSITFKNSPIIEEKMGEGLYGTTIDKVKEMEKTSKFLKKISSADLGISVYKVDDLYNVVLGGTQDYDPNAGLNVALIILAGATLPTTDTSYFSFNPSYYNYYSYGATKSTYINCLFDKNFNHLTGDIPLNTFDILYDFENSLENPYATNIFIHNDKLHYNYLNVKKGKFTLYSFE